MEQRDRSSTGRDARRRSLRPRHILRGGVVALCLFGLSACAPVAAIDSLSNPPEPPPSPPAVPTVAKSGAGAAPAVPARTAVPVTDHDRSRQVYPEYTPYSRDPIPSYRSPDAQTAPPTSVQIDRLERRLDGLRRDSGDDRADRRLSPGAEDAGRVRDNLNSSRIRRLERGY